MTMNPYLLVKTDKEPRIKYLLLHHTCQKHKICFCGLLGDSTGKGGESLMRISQGQFTSKRAKDDIRGIIRSLHLFEFWLRISQSLQSHGNSTVAKQWSIAESHNIRPGSLEVNVFSEISSKWLFNKHMWNTDVTWDISIGSNIYCSSPDPYSSGSLGFLIFSLHLKYFLCLFFRNISISFGSWELDWAWLAWTNLIYFFLESLTLAYRVAQLSRTHLLKQEVITRRRPPMFRSLKNHIHVVRWVANKLNTYIHICRNKQTNILQQRPRVRKSGNREV